MSHEKHTELINTLHECAQASNHCFDACLKEEDVKMMTECIRLCRETAEFAAYFEHALARNTPFVSQLAGICAEICEACADECKKHDDAHCQQCAESCMRCAEVCRQAA